MDISRFIEFFGESTDLGYLEDHFPRYCITQKLAYRCWKWERADILDVGAHWLHQSVLYAKDGHRVTAADFPKTLEDPVTCAVATRHGVNLLTYEDLSSASVFDQLAENSMDVILFCEILEHITFNPVNLWRAIYRVLRPGGRIIVTTPNFYAAGNLFCSFARLLTGGGCGVSVSEIVHTRTMGVHWKEYSKKELRRYFGLLSPDFVVSEQHYFTYIPEFDLLNWKGKLVHGRHNVVPVLRKGLFATVDLVTKDYPIAIEPSW